MNRLSRCLIALLAGALLAGCGEESGGGAKNKKGAAAPSRSPEPTPPPPPAARPAQPASSPANDARELAKFIPQNLSLAIGVTSGFAEKEIAPRVLTQFQPLVLLLLKTGINLDLVDQFWVGSNRDTGDLILCVRTKSPYEAGAVNKQLGVEGDAEKIGEANLLPLPAHSNFKNAIAHVNTRTLLIGRRQTVEAALKSPPAGAVRHGLDVIIEMAPYLWLAGNPAAGRQCLAASGINVLDRAAPEDSGAQGWAIGFGSFKRKPPAAPASRGASPDPNDEDENPSVNMAYVRSLQQGQQGAGAAAPGGPAVDLALGLSFDSEARARTFEQKYNDAVKPRPNVLPTPPGVLGSPTVGTAPGIGRDQSEVWLTLAVPMTESPLLAHAIGSIMPATGASPANDGIFDGTLSLLGVGLQAWPLVRPETYKGVRRVGDQHVREGYSWMTELLPFIGQEPLYGAFDFSKSWSEKENRRLASFAIPAFLNPADSRSHWVGYPFDGMGLTHFVGVSGVEDSRDVIAATLPRNDPRAGIFGYDEVVKLTDIPDGAGQTIMLIGSGAAAAPWVQGGGATIRGARAPYFDKDSGFGSRGLSNGAFVLMADGSARVISGNIDPAVFRALCTVRGGEPVGSARPPSGAQ